MEEKRKLTALTITPPLPGQECYLYTYVLYHHPKNGLLGWFKMIATHGDPKTCINDFKRVESTNTDYVMKWGLTGGWVPIRTLESDHEGTIDLVKMDDEEEEFMGVKLPTRDKVKETDEVEKLFDQAAVDNFKSTMKVKDDEEKRMKLRQRALQEIKEALDDPTTLSSYAQLHWKRLVQKSAIAEYKEKVVEAQTALLGTLKEIGARKRQYPLYERQWHDEIRRIQKISNPKSAQKNPVDQPIAELGDYDDEELATFKMQSVKDDFDEGVGVDAKEKELLQPKLKDLEKKKKELEDQKKLISQQPLDNNNGKKGDKEKEEETEETKKDREEKLNKLKEIDANLEKVRIETEKARMGVERSFMPDAPTQKIGPKSKKKKKKTKKPADAGYQVVGNKGGGNKGEATKKGGTKK